MEALFFLRPTTCAHYTKTTMKSTSTWRELMRCDDKRLAQIVTVTIASMEFDVRCTHIDDPFAERRLPLSAPFSIEVREDDWQDLTDVLHDLIAEQLEFDAYVERRDAGVGRRQRQFLLILVGVVAALAATGAIEL